MAGFFTLRWNQGHLDFIDQTRLPFEERIVSTNDVHVVAEAILSLRIRGAPAIGVAAAYGVVLAAAKESAFANQPALARQGIALLRSTRPTAVNLFYALDRMERCLAEEGGEYHLLERLLDEARSIEAEDVQSCRRISELGADLLSAQCTVLTHCNAGALATAGEGTAVGVIIEGFRRGMVKRVFVDETRPLLQGARLTAWELERAGVPTVLMTDNAAGSAMAAGKINAVVVGADRIAANGDVANKVGTYPVAVLARRHNIPMYVAAPMSTIDRATPSGAHIVIEERSASEVISFAGIPVAPPSVSVYSPAFDVTPNELITAIVTEQRVLKAPFGAAIASLPVFDFGRDRRS